MSGAQSPANDLSGLEVQNNRQVVLLTSEPQMREVLHPTTGIHHPSVALAGLRHCLVPKDCELFEGIWCGSYLGWLLATAPPLVAGAGNGDICQITNSPRLYLAPIQMNSKSLNAVERMLGMCRTECGCIPRIFELLPGCCSVVVGATDM